MRNLLLLCMAAFSFGLTQAQDHTVLAGNYYYNPATLTVTAGETIEFLNEGGFHNVNGVSSTLGDTWNNPETFSLGANSGAAGGVSMGTITLNTPGTYQYDCSIGSHAANGMVGTIVVEAATTASDDLVSLTFDDASSTSGWEAIADATLPEASLGWNASGVSGGALSLSGTNSVDGIGRAYIFQYIDANVDYAGSSDVNLSFDVKSDGPLVGAAVQMQTEFPGAGTINTFDIQNQGINDASWTNLSFDFSNVSGNGIFRLQFNIAAGAFVGAGGTLLIDNITLTGSEGTGGNGGDTDASPTDNAADPSQDASDVVSIYGGSYPSVATNFNPGWGQSGTVNTDFDPGTGNVVLEYAGFNYQGTEITPTDLSSMTHLHVDVWVPEGTDRQLKVTPVNSGAGTPETLVSIPLTPGAWSSVNLAKADFTGMTWDNVIQMKFDGQFNGDGSGNPAPWTVYIDNLYFYNDGSGDNGGGDPGDGGDPGTVLVNLTFDDAASVDPWQAVADATISDEASLAWNASGVETGALEMSGTNSADGIGRAYIFQYIDANVDYAGSSQVTLSFDVKSDGPLVGAAVQMQTEFPGAGTINTFDIQNQGINEAGWTNLSFDFDNISGNGIFRLQFNIAAGAFVGAGGTLLVDNISLTGSGNGGGGTTDTYDVTFNVNTANITVGPNGMYLGGGVFGGAQAHAMSDDDGDGTYSVTVAVDAGTAGNYIFLNSPANDADWGTKENLAGLPCGDPGNFNDRILPAVTEDTTISTCFGECSTDGSCTPVVVGDSLVATLDVSCSGMTDINEVRITGPFWGWDPVGGPLATLNAEGLYEVVFIPAPDANMEYKWLINGEQEDLLDFSDEDLDGDGNNDFLNAACVTITDYFSYANRQWTVGSDDIADTWSQCAPCAPLDSVMVTLTVDMTEEGANPIGVFVVGTFQGWSPGSTQATDNGDGTFSHTFMAAPGDEVQYKWLNGTSYDFEENIPSGCIYADSNRGFVVPNENYSHPVHCFSSCNPCGAATYDVTFTVLTDNITVAADGMFLAGAMEGWSGTAMSDNGDGSWSLTLSLETGDYEFKFQNGSGGWEELDCGGNRSVSVDGTGAVSYTGCFAQCGESAVCLTDPDPANITFRVDMSEVAGLIADSVYMIGSFTDPVWQAGAILMDDTDGDLVYEATVLVDGPAGIAYKFFNGNPYPGGVSTEEGGETADFAAAGCGVDNGVGGFNRTYDRTGLDETLDVVCFNSCAACGDAPLDGTEVTFSVDMNNYTGTFGFVNVSGNWNDFCADCNQMTDDDLDGIWTATIALPEGVNYRYKFQVDAWSDQENLAPADDPIGPCVVKEGGFTNRDLDVAGADPIVLDVVCWASCQACIGDGDLAGCNDETASNYDSAATANDGSCIYDVTFSVNMNEYPLADGDSIYLNGEFNGWCGVCNPMSDDDMDGVWTVTIPLASDYYEYKFTVGNFSPAENLTGLSGCVTENFGFTNRVLQLFGNQSEPVVCWNSCANCEGTGDISGCTDSNALNYAAVATVDDGSCQYNVTFRVDMSTAGLTETDVAYVNGTFNGWCGVCNPMSDDDMDGVWTLTIPLTAGEHEYKFTINGWSMQEELTVGDICDFNPNDGFANRGFNLTADLDLPVVCYNSCYTCDVLTGCTDSAAQNYDSSATVDDGSCAYIVTLRLDMSQQVVSDMGVHVAGSFQGWNPSGTPMTSPGLGIYEYTLQLSNGAHQFIYINGNDWPGQETVPAECGVDNGLGGYNREVMVNGADLTLNVVCFGSCTACAGCTDPLSAEFSPFAGEDDGSCATPLVFGCTYTDADNFNVAANMEDGTCEFTGGSSCPTDIDGDGSTAVGDLLVILGAFGQTCAE